MTGSIIFDGTQRMKACKCSPDCEFPCWQRVGIAPACEACECGVGTLAASMKEPPQPPVQIAIELPPGSVVRLPQDVEVKRRRKRSSGGR